MVHSLNVVGVGKRQVTSRQYGISLRLNSIDSPVGLSNLLSNIRDIFSVE